MSSLGAVVVVVLAVLLLAALVLLLRARRATAWPVILLAMITSGVCFTIGGDSARDSSEPSVATVVGAVVGLLSVAAAIVALIRRPVDTPLSRVPTHLASAAIVIGALGLLVNELVS